MMRLYFGEGYDVWFSQLKHPYAFTTPFDSQEFALMLVVADTNVTDEERAALSREIVHQHCRYAVCTGEECSRWDDAIDFAYLETSPDYAPPDETFVMTTWHANESLEDVAFFFRFNTSFDNWSARNFLVLLLGGDDETIRRVCLAVAKLFRSVDG